MSFIFKTFSDDERSVRPEELKLRNLREVYLTEDQFKECLKSSSTFAQNQHMSSGFRPRDYKLLKGGATLGIGNPKSLFTEKKEAQEMPELVGRSLSLEIF